MVAVDEDKVTLRATEKNVIAGGIAGCLAKTVTAPLSRLTVLYQVGPLLNAHSSSTTLTKVGVENSLLTTCLDIIEKEGVLSLWKGNFTSAVIHRFPYSAIQFSSYEAMKTMITHHSIDTGHDHPLVRFLCGAASGGVACISCYPLDIVRTRLIVGSNPAPTAGVGRVRVASRILDLMTEIVHREGFRGLYRGLGATLAVTMPTMGISFTVYGQVKGALLDHGGIFVNESTGHLSAWGALLSGSVSGVASACVTFPGDVIRKRMQVMGAVLPVLPAPSAPVRSLESGKAGLHTSNRPSAMLGMYCHAKDIMKRDGIRGFYRGLLPEVLKVCPTVAIMFCTFEAVRDKLDEHW